MPPLFADLDDLARRGSTKTHATVELCTWHCANPDAGPRTFSNDGGLEPLVAATISETSQAEHTTKGKAVVFTEFPSLAGPLRRVRA